MPGSQDQFPALLSLTERAMPHAYPPSASETLLELHAPAGLQPSREQP